MAIVIGGEPRSRMPLSHKILVPIPHEFDYVPEDIYPLEGGGFQCFMCLSDPADKVENIRHRFYCQYAGPGPFRTHGDARRDYQEGKPL